MVSGEQTQLIHVTGDQLSAHFDRFDIDAYREFLRCKRLPEYRLEYHDPAGDPFAAMANLLSPEACTPPTYTISAPARFAAMLGIDGYQRAAAKPVPCPKAFDDQVWITDRAIEAKRFAVWSDCGLGKTLILWWFGLRVHEITGGKYLVFTLNDIVDQTIEQFPDFFPGYRLPVRLNTRDQMKAWAKAEYNPDDPDDSPLAITNYEKMNHKTKADQVVPELRYLAGICLDESNRLAGGGGKQKWALIHSCKGIEYKLSSTATPAPNDTIEFASQASFLEKMRSEGEIIWTFFGRDKETHEWKVKRHCREAFYEFMASWSIYLRSPKLFGWRKEMADVPEPEIIVQKIPATPEQLKAMRRYCTDKHGQQQLPGLDTEARGIVARGKLSQIAKGFVYTKGTQRVKLIPSLKPEVVCDIIQKERKEGRQVLVWTEYDAETDLIEKVLRHRMEAFRTLTGKIPKAERPEIVKRFKAGQIPVLIGRSKMIGFGMNFQNCKTQIFSGWSDSFVSFYQAVARSVRFDADLERLKQRVRVYLPVIECLEGMILENIFVKRDKNLAAIEEMEKQYIRAMKRMR